MTDLMAAKRNYKAGDTVQMTVNRSGEEVTIDFTFGSQPQDTASAANNDNTGSGNDSNLYEYYYGYNPFGNSRAG